MARKRQYNKIPVALSEKEFTEFVLPHLTKGSRGPAKKISFYKTFNYILKLMHTGCQWYNLPIDKDAFGKSEIHYTVVFKTFRFWNKSGCFDKIFESTVGQRHVNKLFCQQCQKYINYLLQLSRSDLCKQNSVQIM